MENRNQPLSYWIIFIMAAGFVAIVMCHCPCLKGKIFDALLFLATVFSVILAYQQYVEYKEREKYDRLSRLNERYATDKNITSVIESIQACYNDNDKSFDVEQFRYNPGVSKIHQREMFLRFFEELHYAIKVGSLNKEDVCYYFSYYAIVASLMGKSS